MHPLPKYTVRYSNRAKYVRLSICPQKGLEVILPYGSKPDCIPNLLQKKQNWIKKHLKSKKTKPTLPNTIYLQSIDKEIEVEFARYSDKGSIYYELFSDRLLLSGNTRDQFLVQQALIAGLKEHAKPVLKMHLSQFAEKHNLSFEKMSVRLQKTRWGSCSSKRNISLNLKLMFLPKELRDYVLLHELTHTKHMNHSTKFWQSLEKILPQYRTLDKQMKTANQYIPQWLEYTF